MRIDRALRDVFNLRSSLKAESLQSWRACGHSLLDVVSIIGSDACVFKSATDKSAAVWVQWRKSNISKQLLGLVRSALEAASAQSSRRAVPVPDVKCMELMALGLHVSIFIIDMLLDASKGVLWPALREWLMEQGVVPSMWRALTWDLQRTTFVGGGSGDAATRRRAIPAVLGSRTSREEHNARALSILDSIRNITSLSMWLGHPHLSPQPMDTLHQSDGITALQITLGELLPAAFPVMQPSVRKRAVTFCRRIDSHCMICSASGGLMYPKPPLHLPALRAWPYLVGAARHHLLLPVQDSEERENIQVGVHGRRCLGHCAWCMAARVWGMGYAGKGLAGA